MKKNKLWGIMMLVFVFGIAISSKASEDENISPLYSVQNKELTKEVSPHPNVDKPNNRSTGIFFNLTTSFHGKTPIFGLFAEQSDYNGVHLEAGLRTNFKRSDIISFHVGGGYNLGLYNDNKICVSCVIPVSFDIRMSSFPKGLPSNLANLLVNPYLKPKYDKYESDAYFDLCFSPRLKATYGKVILSAGYWMTSTKFKFKKGYLEHSAIFSIGYNFW